MCEISTDLKLCTCTNTEELENSWELYIYHNDQDLLVVGQPMFPVFLTPQDLKNKEIILSLLNQKNCFDFDYTPKSKDRLLITLKNTADDSLEYGSEYIFHGFSYTGKHWKHEEYDALEWMWKHEVEKQGEIKNLYK